MSIQSLRSGRRYGYRILSGIFLLAGALLMGYPWISNLHNERVAEAEIRVCEKEVSQLQAEQVLEMRQKASAYNMSLWRQNVKLADSFYGENSRREDPLYDQLLACGTQGIMGHIEIPCIDLSLPVYHGTSEKVLEKGIGHLQGSSLPVGGRGCHAVLTGHTGLDRAKLFTDLIQMEKGDVFFLHVLDQTLAYRVEQIWTVLPEETEKLQIKKNEDLVTLVTCTPYGINDHRLFVQGKRTACTETAYEKERAKGHSRSSLWMQAYARACALGLAFLAGVLAVKKMYGRYRIKKRRDDP